MSDNRTRIWFSLFVLAIFGLGLATGLFMGRRMAPPPGVSPAMARGPLAPIGPPRERLIERLDRVLRLTDGQRDQIDGILVSRGERLAAVQREVAERTAREQRELQSEIRGVLTPEQQQRFDRWLRAAPRGLGGGRGRGGPPPR